MTHPLSGPFSKAITLPDRDNQTGGRPQGVYIYRQWYRQPKPYNVPSPFVFQKRWVHNRVAIGTYDNGPGLSYRPLQFDLDHLIPALNKAYAKFVEEVSEQSQWANNIIEGRKTFKGAVARVTQLVDFTRKVRRLDFVGASKVLGMKKPPRAVSRRHQFGNNWLEYHFGWEPLVKDIGVGMKALCTDFGSRRVTARSSTQSTTVDHYSRPPVYEHETTEIQSGVKFGADVRVVNPNVSLLSDFGFVNPLSVAWEAVPFSFVVDWFVNVGQILGSASDFVGKELSNPYTTTFQRQTWNGHFNGVVPGNSGPPEDGPWSVAFGLTAVYVRRSSGITGPRLIVKPFKGFSVIRGATAVALLNQFLKR